MESLKTVQRTIEALFEISRNGGLGARELARRLGYTKSGVHRILTTLVGYDLVRQDPATKQYRLGYGIQQLSAALMRGNDLIETSLPHMRQLSEAIGETVCLYVTKHMALIPVAQVECRQELRSAVDLSSPLPLHCGAASKVLLAFMSQAEITQVRRLLKFTALTRKTPKSWRSLARELAIARHRGWAISWGENSAGVVGLAAPVWGREGRVVAAVGIYGPMSRIDQALAKRLVRDVVSTATRISTESGFAGTDMTEARQGKSLRLAPDGANPRPRQASPVRRP